MSTYTFNLDLGDAIEEAFERAGSELKSGYDYRTARRSLNLMFLEWQNRGLNLWTIDSGTQTLTAGTSQYTLPADTIDLLDHVIRTDAGNTTTQADLTISRIGVSTYASIPNKLTTGRPIQVFIERLITPRINLWPVPDTSYTFVYFRMRRVQDAGNGAETPDIVFRFLPCLVAGLAYHIAMKVPELAPRIEMLKAVYDEQYALAAGEDREKTSENFVPRIGRI